MSFIIITRSRAKGLEKMVGAIYPRGKMVLDRDLLV